MADSVRKVAYFAMQIPNRRGEGAAVLGPLADMGVDLLGFTGFPSAKGSQVDFIPRDPAAFLRVAKKLGIRVKPKKYGFLAQGKDRKGAVACLLATLAEAKVNVTAIDAVSAPGKNFAALLWVKDKDYARAAKALKAK